MDTPDKVIKEADKLYKLAISDRRDRLPKMVKSVGLSKYWNVGGSSRGFDIKVKIPSKNQYVPKWVAKAIKDSKWNSLSPEHLVEPVLNKKALNQIKKLIAGYSDFLDPRKVTLWPLSGKLDIGRSRKSRDVIAEQEGKLFLNANGELSRVLDDPERYVGMDSDIVFAKTLNYLDYVNNVELNYLEDTKSALDDVARTSERIISDTLTRMSDRDWEMALSARPYKIEFDRNAAVASLLKVARNLLAVSEVVQEIVRQFSPSIGEHESYLTRKTGRKFKLLKPMLAEGPNTAIIKFISRKRRNEDMAPQVGVKIKYDRGNDTYDVTPFMVTPMVSDPDDPYSPPTGGEAVWGRKMNGIYFDQFSDPQIFYYKLDLDEVG